MSGDMNKNPYNTHDTAMNQLSEEIVEVMEPLIYNQKLDIKDKSSTLNVSHNEFNDMYKANRQKDLKTIPVDGKNFRQIKSKNISKLAEDEDIEKISHRARRNNTGMIVPNLNA